MLRPSLKSSQKHLAALRQLALTAQGGRAALIEALRLMQHIVPTDNISIFWKDKYANVIDLHNELDIPLPIALDFLENFTQPTVQNGECNSYPTIVQTQSIDKRVTYNNKSPVFNHKQFINSEFYNRILRPIDLGRAVEMQVKHANNAPLATLTFARSFLSADYTAAEVNLLVQAQPWLEHLARNESLSAAETHSNLNGESASLLIDAKGKVLSSSAFALTLLHQAADTPIAAKSLRLSVQGDVSILLRRLSSSVANALNSLFALPPSLVINNRWGRFQLHAHVLSAFETGAPIQISLHIEKQVPLSLGLFRLPRFLELSPREREVGLFMLAGLDRNEIARELGVKPSTIVYFTRQLYRRLDINQQSELLPSLMQV
jgi:DNA-binding NarL/FixJ family response regulator